MATKSTKKRGPGRPKGSTNKPKAHATPKAAPMPTLSSLGEAAIVSSMTGAMAALQTSAEPKGLPKSLLLVPAGTRVVLEDGEKSEQYPVIALALLDTGVVVPVVHDVDSKALMVLPTEVPIKAWLHPGE